MTEPAAPSTGPLDPRRALPAVSALLDMPDVQALVAAHGRTAVTDALRAVLDGYRRALRPEDAPPDAAAVARRVAEAVADAARVRLRPVVNATGIVLHTGLGRAVLPPRAVDALAGLKGCCNLQIDLDTGLRGQRDAACERLLVQLTGAPAALLVNNNAAATYLILAALCRDRDVIVSRGQLIEIGGSFRLPDCVHQSGARLVEVGTTNKTHLRDYAAALGPNTGAILRVNPSNYRIVGFTQDVPVRDLVSLRAKQPVLVIDDLGCGALVDLRAYGLPHEPTVPESLAAGADLACFSGDKLIGGPQCGIIVGRQDLVARLRKHPLTRLLRVDKLTAMALEHTLRLFQEPDTLLQHHPTLRMLALPAAAVRARAARLEALAAARNPALQLRIVATASSTGGGALPGYDLPSFALAVTSDTLSAAQISRRLRRHEPPVIARIEDDAVLLDARTLQDEDEAAVVEALARLGAPA